MYSKTTINKTIEAIKDYLNDLDDNETVNIHNTYCREQNDSDDEIFNNDEDFFNAFFEGRVLEAVRAVSFGEYRYQDEFIKFNGYGNLETFNNPADHVDISAIAEDILESPEKYDIELNEVFECDGLLYEGSEEDAKEEYEEYKTSIAEDIERLKGIIDNQKNDDNSEYEEEINDLEKDLLSFFAWVKENITIAEEEEEEETN